METQTNNLTPQTSTSSSGFDTGQNFQDLVGTADKQGLITANDAPKTTEVGFKKGFEIGTDYDWLSYSVKNMIHDAELAHDPSFDPNKDISLDDLEGVPTEYIPDLKEAKSEAEFHAKKNRLMTELAADKEAASGGIPAIAGRMLSNVLDPSTIPMALATYGAGLGVKGVRMMQALKAGVQGMAVQGSASYLLSQGKESYTTKDAILDTSLGFFTNASLQGLFHNKEAAMAAMQHSIAARAHMDDTVKFKDELDAEVHREGTHSRAMIDAMEHEHELDGKPFESYKGDARFTGMSVSAVLQRSKNKHVKALGDKLATNYGGYKSGAEAELSAENHMTRENGYVMNQFAKMQNKYSNLFLRDHKDKYSFSEIHYNAKHTHDLNHRVGKYLAGVTTDTETDKHVLGMAKDMQQLFKHIGEKAQRDGVEGADKLDLNSDYFTRMWDKVAIRKHSQENPNALEDLFVKSIKQAQPTLEDSLVKRMGRGMLRTLTTSHSFDMDLANLAKSTPDTIEYFLKELQASGADVSSDMIDTVTNHFKFLKDTKDKRANKESEKYFRRKTLMDTAASVELHDGKLLSLSDLFETNASTVMSKYSRYMAGASALAKKGIRSKQEFNAILNKAEAEAQRTRDPNWKSEKDRLDVLKKLLSGNPLENDTGSLTSQASRAIRKYNYYSYMGNLLWSMVCEIPNVMMTAGVRNSLKHIPYAVQAMHRIAKTDSKHAQELSNVMARELDILSGGFGSEFFVSKNVHNIDEGLQRGNDFINESGFKGTYARGLNQAEHATEKLSRVTSRLSTWLDTYLKRWTLRSSLENFIDLAEGKTLNGITGLTKERRKLLGISDQDLAKITDNINKHVTRRDGRVSQLNIEKWDKDALETLGTALRKIGGFVIQENDVSSSMPFMHNSIAKILLQFRSWSLHSMNKQLKMHGGLIAEDPVYLANTLAITTLSSIIGGLTWAGMERAKGKDSSDITLEAIVRNGVARSTTLGLMPPIMDTLISPFHDPLFSQSRSSGQSSDLLANPTFSDLDNLKSLYSILGNYRDDKYFSQHQAKAVQKLSGIGSYPVISKALNTYIKELPE